MTLVLIVAVVLVVLLLSTVRSVRGDGYGHRPPPPDRHSWHHGVPAELRRLN